MKVPIDSIHSKPEWEPEMDETFIRLFTEAIDGRVPVFFAAVPSALCVPFDLDYRPDKIEPIAALIRKYEADNKDRKVPFLTVYPRGIWFVVSDDYPKLFACFKGLPEYVPCLILGKPDNEYIRGLKGPIDPVDVRKYFGV